MGIRFFCPQGHKLNVKSFLAGKIGFCPYCNAKVQIPMESTRASSKERGAAGGASPLSVPVSGPQHAAAVQADADQPPAAAPLAQPITQAQAGAPVAQPLAVPSATTQAQPTVSQPNAAQPTALPHPVQPQQSVAVVGAVAAVPDPIAEAPQAVWYVRPASGGQFGPATGDLMRQWLGQGRIAPDSLVWCEGWPDWRSADSTFPQFSGGHSQV